VMFLHDYSVFCVNAAGNGGESGNSGKICGRFEKFSISYRRLPREFASQIHS